MGMFDWVNYEAPCMKCGALIDNRNWQSKSGQCQMVTLEPWEVRAFYSSCPVCHAWNQYAVVLDGPVPPKPQVPFHVVAEHRDWIPIDDPD